MLNSSRHESVILAVVMERRRQHIMDTRGLSLVVVGAPNESAHKSLAVLVEEVGEVARAIHEGHPEHRLADELVQVAAVATAMAEAALGRIATTDATDDTGIGALQPHD